jgi:hypothetical protein
MDKLSVKTKQRGRPLKFNDPQEIANKGDQFFTDCDEKKIPYTITGLAIALGFTSRQMLAEYEMHEGFGDIIKRLRIRVETEVEKRLFGNNPTGSIFWLKNYGWKDKTEVEISGDLTLSARVAESRKRLKTGIENT